MAIVRAGIGRGLTDNTFLRQSRTVGSGAQDPGRIQSPSAISHCSGLNSRASLSLNDSLAHSDQSTLFPEEFAPEHVPGSNTLTTEDYRQALLSLHSRDIPLDTPGQGFLFSAACLIKEPEESRFHGRHQADKCEYSFSQPSDASATMQQPNVWLSVVPTRYTQSLSPENRAMVEQHLNAFLAEHRNPGGAVSHISWLQPAIFTPRMTIELSDNVRDINQVVAHIYQVTDAFLRQTVGQYTTAQWRTFGDVVDANSEGARLQHSWQETTAPQISSMGYALNLDTLVNQLQAIPGVVSLSILSVDADDEHISVAGENTCCWQVSDGYYPLLWGEAPLELLASCNGPLILASKGGIYSPLNSSVIESYLAPAERIETAPTMLSAGQFHAQTAYIPAGQRLPDAVIDAPACPEHQSLLPVGLSSADDRGFFPVRQKDGNNNDGLFSFIGESHLQEAREFRRKGYNSQLPEVDPGLMAQLREAVSAAKSCIHFQSGAGGPPGSLWLLAHLGKIDRFADKLSDERMQEWVRHELPRKIKERAEETSLGNRSAAQSLVRRLESTLQTLIRVVHTLRVIHEQRRDMFATVPTDQFSSGNESTVVQAVGRVAAEVVGNAIRDPFMQAREEATLSAMVTATRHEAEKANKKARELQGDSRAFFSHVAAYLQRLSGDLAKASINTSQGASSPMMSPENDEAADVPLSRSDPLTQRIRVGFTKKKKQGHVVLAVAKRYAYRGAGIIRHGHLTAAPGKESEQVIADSIIRSILWQWQQPAIKIQHASSALLSKVDELKKTAQARHWGNDSPEEERNGNPLAAKVMTLERLLGSEIASARNLVMRLGKTKDSVQNLLRRQRFAVLKMVVERFPVAAPSLKAVDRVLPDIARNLTASIVALDKALQVAECPSRRFAETKKQADYAQLLATKVKERLSAESARLTDRPLDEQSRGSRLARHWANLAREQNMGDYPPPDAGQVLFSLKEQGLLAGTLSAGDPAGYLFATRLAGELENSRNNELRLPMSPEQYSALEKGLVEYIVKWGQKRISREVPRIVIELSFEQALDTVSFSVSSLFRLPYKVLKASIKIPYNVNKVNNYTMPGHDKPYKAIYSLLGKKLKQLGFNLLTAPVPGVIKLAAGAGITAGAVLHNLHIGNREKTFSAVYQNIAEGKKNEKIKMNTLGGMLFDSAIDSNSAAVFKGVGKSWKLKESEYDVDLDKRYIREFIEEEQSQWLRENMKIPHGARFIVTGDRKFIMAVRKHIEEIQKHLSGRTVLERLAGRNIRIRPPRHEDFFREEDGVQYFGSRVIGESIFFDPYNTYYGVNRENDVEAWRDLDPSIVLFHELLHIYTGDSRHDTIIPSEPTRLDENDYRREFYESRKLNVLERQLSENENHDGQYADVGMREDVSVSEESGVVQKEIADALIKFESDNKDKSISDIKKIIFLDEYVYNKMKSSDSKRKEYRKEWSKIRGELEGIKNRRINDYLYYHSVIESYDVFRGNLLSDDISDSMNNERKKMMKLFAALKSKNNPHSYDLDVAINNFGAYVADVLAEMNYDEEDNDDDKLMKIAAIYYYLNKNGVGNELDLKYMEILNCYLPNEDKIFNGSERSRVNIMGIIDALEGIQNGHFDAYTSVAEVNDIMDILSVQGKASEELFLDAKVMAAQIYDGVNDVSLVKDRMKWLGRYDEIKQEPDNDVMELLQIEAIIYYLQKENSEDYIDVVKYESGILLLTLLLANSDRELKKIMHLKNEEFISYSKFRTRKDLGNDDSKYYSQFDNYKDSNAAEKEARRQLLGITHHLKLSLGELFQQVERVKIFSYVCRNNTGSIAVASPGRAIVIKLKGSDAGAIVISNLFLNEYVNRISNDEYNQLFPLLYSEQRGDVAHRALKGPYYYRGTQDEHTSACRILTGMDEEEIRKLLAKRNIILGYPARFSFEFPGVENIKNLEGKTLRDAIIGTKTIENNAAANYLRSAMYSLIDWEEIAYRFVPFYEIGHRNETDRDYEINIEQFITELISTASIAFPAAKGISTSIRSLSIPKILKSGLKGSALYKAVFNEMGRVSFSTSKIFGTAIYELIEPFPVNSHFSKSVVFDEATEISKAKHFRPDWVVDKAFLGEIKPDDNGVYKIKKVGESAMQCFDYYIKNNNRFYAVKYDTDNNTWRLIPPANSGKNGYQAPVKRNKYGEWMLHVDVGLKGGGLKDWLGAIRKAGRKVRPQACTTLEMADPSCKSDVLTLNTKTIEPGTSKLTIETVLEERKYKNLSDVENQLINDVSAYLKTNLGKEYDIYLANPRDNCANAAVAVANTLRQGSYTEVRIMELGFWPNGGVETIPTNHYVVMAKKDGVEISVDLTAGQFELYGYGFSGPIINTKDNWIYQWKQEMKNKPRLLVKMVPLSGGISTSLFRMDYVDSQLTVPNGTLLQRPAWYKKDVAYTDIIFE